MIRVPPRFPRTDTSFPYSTLFQSAHGAVVEGNSETDFVARNESFEDFVRKVAGVALEVGDDVEALKAAKLPGTGNPVADELTNMIARIGENMSLRRAASIAVAAGVDCTYILNQTAPGLREIGVLVGLASNYRKTFGEGKSVSVRVDRGFCRLIKNKNK